MPGFYHSRDLRRGRFSEPERIYLITTVTRDRKPVFRDLWAGRALVRVLGEIQHRSMADTLAFVVMPDHLHWLMQLGMERDLSGIVAAVKSLSARRIAGRSLWQPGFHDHAIREEEDLAGMARYIVANPLRAGLVRRVADYPHWDAIWL